MVKLGWLHDDLGIVGGSELSGQALLQNRPADVEIVLCHPGFRPPADIDAFMLQNCATYTSLWIEALETRPVIKHFRDPWHYGDIMLRRWVLGHAKHLLFNSQLAVDTSPWYIDRPYSLVPPPVDLDLFRQARLPLDARQGNIFVGRVSPVKGAHIAIDWALRHAEPLDLYGTVELPTSGLPDNIRFHGAIPYAYLPGIYGAARRFVFFPGAVESYSRTTVEAWAAGCELLLDSEKIGAVEWLQEAPQAIEFEAAITAFWEIVMGVLERG
jgi:glycosyltransferase involved in cell wall biosynthesis